MSRPAAAGAGPDCRGDLYMDDGETYAYQKGDVLRVHFTCHAAADHVSLHMAVDEATYHPWFKEMQLTVYGSDKVRDVTVDGTPVKNWKAAAGTVTVEGVPWTATARDVQILYNIR